MAGHPDEVVKPEHEKPSDLVAEAKLRHEWANTDEATPQEKKQAAVEKAHALSTRPDGSYAQLHETEEPTLAVADDKRVSELRKEAKEAVKARDEVSDEERKRAEASRPADAPPAKAAK